MPVLQVQCPECDAKLNSKVGFTAGQEITCPKCDAEFALPKSQKPTVLDEDDDAPTPKKKKRPRVVEDEDDEEDERPKKRKKKKVNEEGQYANSPLRFVILGVLVVTMLVLGFFLYRKYTAPPLPDIIVPAKNDDGR